MRSHVEPLFQQGWKHKRIEQELAKQETIKAKRAMAGQKGGLVSAFARQMLREPMSKRRVQTQANAEQMGSSHSHKESSLTSTESGAEKGAAEKRPSAESLEDVIRRKGWA